ncbi:hypothetical protein GCM10017774_03500 [Lentzea cavernae]|uniref:Uncharacterized protein n=1 Tax=Lentzea cavernae TaxID=2020703 RepID=A0ABQ3M0E8_9PSEU|nr:hypothetical protein GCM10017774_03500 [Lentzea cavernae]
MLFNDGCRCVHYVFSAAHGSESWESIKSAACRMVTAGFAGVGPDFLPSGVELDPGPVIRSGVNNPRKWGRPPACAGYENHCDATFRLPVRVRTRPERRIAGWAISCKGQLLFGSERSNEQEPPRSWRAPP